MSSARRRSDVAAGAARSSGPEQRDDPASRLAILTCMDTRIDLAAITAVEPAVLLTNAGALVTDDVRRAVELARRQGRIDEIWIVMHTDCRMHGLDNEAFLAGIETETGRRPEWAPGGFESLEAELRRGVEQLHSEPSLEDITVCGFVLDLESGQLEAFGGPR